MYDDNYLPNFRRIQLESLGFSGFSSNSLPTNGGWLSFVAGNNNIYLGNAMVQDIYNDLDDLPSYMRYTGYYNQAITTSPLDFDGKM